MVYSKKEAAKRLGVSEKTIDRRIKDGTLAYHQIGKRVLFDDEDLNAYWDSCRRQAKKIGDDVA